MIIIKPSSTNKEIEQLRNKLVKMGLEVGMSHPATIQLSQKLDELLLNVVERSK